MSVVCVCVCVLPPISTKPQLQGCWKYIAVHSDRENSPQGWTTSLFWSGERKLLSAGRMATPGGGGEWGGGWKGEEEVREDGALTRCKQRDSGGTVLMSTFFWTNWRINNVDLSLLSVDCRLRKENPRRVNFVLALENPPTLFCIEFASRILQQQQSCQVLVIEKCQNLF